MAVDRDESKTDAREKLVASEVVAEAITAMRNDANAAAAADAIEKAWNDGKLDIDQMLREIKAIKKTSHKDEA
jgi:hypothetical protein